MDKVCIQEQFMPNGQCFGCGPANEQGLRLRSFPRGEILVATWEPKPYHQAFPGVLNGGIIGSLLDCHGNWTAAWALMHRDGTHEPPCTVTAEYAVKLLRPTPIDVPVHLTAHAVKFGSRSATIEAKLEAGEWICATCTGVFVSVPPDHPGYYRHS